MNEVQTGFIMFMLFSILETSAIYYLMFRLFKIDIYFSSILFASSVPAFFSYTMRMQYHLPAVDVALQILLMFLFLWQVFKVHPFYATFMTSTVYLGYAFLQTVILGIMLKLHLLYQVQSPINWSVYALQTSSALTAILIGWVIWKKQKGFSFVPHSNVGKIKMNRINTLLLLVNVPALLAMVLNIYFESTSPSILPSLFAGFGGVFLCLIILILINKEWNSD